MPGNQEYMPGNQLTIITVCLNTRPQTPVATVTSGAVPVSVGSPLPESAVEKIAKAHELKQEGNSLFKAGQLRRAMRKYHHGLLYVKGVVNQVPGLPAVERLVRVKASPAEEEEANELIGALSNNLAGAVMWRVERIHEVWYGMEGGFIKWVPSMLTFWVSGTVNCGPVGGYHNSIIMMTSDSSVLVAGAVSVSRSPHKSGLTSTHGTFDHPPREDTQRLLYHNSEIIIYQLFMLARNFICITRLLIYLWCYIPLLIVLLIIVWNCFIHVCDSAACLLKAQEWDKALTHTNKVSDNY